MSGCFTVANLTWSLTGVCPKETLTSSTWLPAGAPMETVEANGSRPSQEALENEKLPFGVRRSYFRLNGGNTHDTRHWGRVLSWRDPANLSH